MTLSLPVSAPDRPALPGRPHGLRSRAGTPAWRLALLLAGAAVLAGCATSTSRAPVSAPRVPVPTTAPGTGAPNLPGGTVSSAPGTGVAVVPQTPLPPGAENAGKPGYYTIKPGDTLIRIGLDMGQNWRDIARWNNLDNANLIEVGQVLRVVPPAPPPSVASTQPVAPSGPVEARTLDGAPAVPGPAAGTPAAGTGPVAPGPMITEGREGDERVPWMWPANGPVVARFDDARSKGLAIAGNTGDPVYAAADGRVVYAGSGLRGYGNLVIVKHNNTYLTAYAHNRALLVREDQVVRRGQQIAEMGDTDAERVQLHFEIRRQGQPVDPARLLPPR
jgi:lipoprotein NlpD